MVQKFIEVIFFNRENSLIFCSCVTFVFFILEFIFKIPNLFSTTGAIFTLAGLFLNIKLTAHFHLKLPDGNKLGDASKYAMITGRLVFGGSESEQEKKEKVKEVEDDEKWGMNFMIIGTLIWAYGSYLINYLQSVFHIF